jgi:hypothetical protein
MYYNIPEGLNLWQHCYENLKFCNCTQHCRCSPPPPPHHSHHSCNSLASCAYPNCSVPWPLQSLQANDGTIQQNLNVWSVNLPWSLILIALFWPSMPGSDKSGYDHVACVLVSPLSWHCTDHSQLSHALSFTVLSCPVTPLHMYCFLLLCCNWPKFLHLQLTAFKSDNDDPPSPTIPMDWASLATVQCTVHFQAVCVFYYK